MKYFSTLLLLSLSGLAREPQKITRTFSMDSTVIIREIGAVIVPKGDGLVVDIVLGNTGRQSADIQKNDDLLMANGKKMGSLTVLREEYENAAAGKEFKLGIRRNGNLLITRFIKKNDAELNASGGRIMMRIDKNDGDEVLPALGLILGTKHTSVVIKGVLPSASRNFKEQMPKEGNVITAINGKKVSTAGDFISVYDKVKEGERVTVEFIRSGTTVTATFEKPRPQGKMMIVK